MRAGTGREVARPRAELTERTLKDRDAGFSHQSHIQADALSTSFLDSEILRKGNREGRHVGRQLTIDGGRLRAEHIHIQNIITRTSK